VCQVSRLATVRRAGFSRQILPKVRCARTPSAWRCLWPDQRTAKDVGVAWRANLRSGAALTEVNIQFAPPMSQIARGVRFAANQYSLLPKVVAMAFGQLTGSDLLSDVIQDLTWNFDVVFIGAAGTDVPAEVGGDGVIIFPASLPWVLAVTSANASGNPDPGTSNHPLARLSALRDNVVGPMLFSGVHPTLGYCESCLVNHSSFSGSSGATAVISGVASLVRSRFPWMSNEQVRDQLVSRSSPQGVYPFPRPHVDALAALGSFCGRMIDFEPDVYVDFETTSDPPRTLQISGMNSCGGFQAPLSYTWNAATDEEPLPSYSSGASVTVMIFPPSSASSQFVESGSVLATITDPTLGSSVQRHVRIHRRATQCIAAGECP
jgi:subtilisin family serine protease